jgi:hypothetical protein
MSYEVLVEGGSAIRVEAWTRALRDLGIACETPPGFVPITWLGWLAVRFEILDTTLFRRAPELAALGPLRVGFSFEVGVPSPETPTAELAALLSVRSGRLARLEATNAPAVAQEKERRRVEHVRALIAGEADPTPARATFRVPARSAAADYIAAVFCAGGLARATEGRLLDTWGDAGWSGDSILAAAPRMVESIGLDDAAYDPAHHDRFDRWPP